MTKRLYVGNLPYTTSEDDVREMFAEYGAIDSLTMITDRFTGDFRGFCFLDMEDEPAKAAMAALDGQDYQGRALRVNEARPRA